MTRFLLIRHATTDAVGKSISGRMPGIHLNRNGQLQASLLAGRLAGLPITAIYSSPLERAIETATPIAAQFHLYNNLCNDFLEIDFGKWTNCTIDALKALPSFKRFNSFRSNTRIPGGESMPEAQLRIVTGMEKLCLQHLQQTIAIVSHADVIKSAIAYYAGIHLDMFQRIEISPASVSCIEIYEETARLLFINNTSSIEF